MLCSAGQDSGTHSPHRTQGNSHLHWLHYLGHVGEIDTSHGTKLQSQRGVEVSEGGTRCRREVSCRPQAADELSIEGVNHSSSHCCQEGRDKDTSHTCQNQVTVGTYRCNPDVPHPSPPFLSSCRVPCKISV